MSAGKLPLESFAMCARRLDLQWETATDHWRDRVRDEFERAHFVPLLHEHQHMADAAAALVEALQMAQRTVR